MHYSRAARARLIALTAGLAASGLALSGCGSIDEALFGPAPAAPATTASSTAPAAPVSQPETAPASEAEQGTAPEGAPAAAPPPMSEGIALASIEPTTSTGTAVAPTIDRLHGELAALHDKAATDLQQLGTLKNAAAQDTTTYEEAKAHIVIRLQLGTTRANPELVSQWNTGQSALDTLAGNINSLAALGSEILTDSGRARTERSTVADTFNVAGANDEDHHELTVLQQEADQITAALDQMQRSVTRSVQRETAFAANERDSLSTLANAIKIGELYPTTEMPQTASLSSSAVSGEPSNAIATIRFDQKKVDFEQQLYAALNQALQARPAASFRVVAVSPTQGSAAAMQVTQKAAHKHAQDVLKSMTDMGVPAARVAISSSTDPSVTASEVRVYVR